MRSGLTIAAVSLLLGSGAGCARSHGSEADDGGIGADGSAGRDAPPGDAARTNDADDAGQRCADDAGCGCLAGFRRCDCEAPCPEGTTCHLTAQVCLPADIERWSDTCLFRVGAFDPEEHERFDAPLNELCDTGGPCAIEASDEGTFDEPFSGICMPVTYCTAVGEAEPRLAEPVRCVYSDGTELESGPPGGEWECPASSTAAPFCGGVCGDAQCPAIERSPFSDPSVPPCVGVSDRRPFGVCPFEESRCREGHTGDLADCREHYGDPCACLVPRPQPEVAAHDWGFVVLRSACRDYARRLFGRAECRDASWNRL